MKEIIERLDKDRILKRYWINDDGRKDGPYLSYHSNGLLDVKCRYRNGQMHGSYQRYDATGKLIVKCAFDSKTEKKHSFFLLYPELFDVNFEIFKLHAIPTGEFKAYHYTNGKLKTKCTFKNGQLEGAAQEFYENGQLKTEYTYQNGIRNGLSKFYHKNGKVSIIYPYKNGKIDGLCEWYTSDGLLSCQCHYEDGQRHGVFKKFDKDGRVKEECLFQNGQECSLYSPQVQTIAKQQTVVLANMVKSERQRSE